MTNPFACFDYEDDVDEYGVITTDCRDKTCGVLCFHRDTERSLLTHIHNNCESSSTIPKILSVIDNFCLQRHWMMHVGPNKGRILTEILKEEIETFLNGRKFADKSPTEDDKNMVEFNCLEIGSYCGYSSILIGKSMESITVSQPDDLHSTTYLFVV